MTGENHMFKKVSRLLKAETLKEPKTLYEPAEKALLERALAGFKPMAVRDFKADLEYTKQTQMLIGRFYGVLGQEIMNATLSQVEVLNIHSECGDPLEIRLQHDLKMETVDGKRVKVEIKTSPPNERARCMIVEKEAWKTLLKKHGKPDFVVAVKLKLRAEAADPFVGPIGVKDLIETLEMLNAKLKWLDQTVEVYNNEFNAEIAGWVEGASIENLNDSESDTEQHRWHPCPYSPCYWVNLTDSRLKPMQEFWSKFLKTVKVQVPLFETGQTRLL
jgi:hypothetical protein